MVKQSVGVELKRLIELFNERKDAFLAAPETPELQIRLLNVAEALCGYIYAHNAQIVKVLAEKNIRGRDVLSLQFALNGLAQNHNLERTTLTKVSAQLLILQNYFE
ncbi:MAG: hypothetical protein H7A36_04845 [Chlamydiales bacterium]|nr:hypothetical protein [Chlamydiales bacterium]